MPAGKQCDMAEPNAEQDELLLMRHLEGRLSATETAALKARLAAEPALAAKLEALDLENDLIAGAVRVPEDVELPEPVMMAIIDQALKDPKRLPAARTWWKPITLSLGAAAAVVLAVLTSFLLNAEKPAAHIVQDLRPDGYAITAQLPDTRTDGVKLRTLLTPGAEILPGTQLASSGGTASLALLKGITLHFDSNTEVTVTAVQPGVQASFELKHGALIVDYHPTAGADGFPSIEVFTSNRRLRVAVERGRTLILPLGSTPPDSPTDYLVYMAEGQGRLTTAADQAENAGAAMALSDGTQVLWPIGTLVPRTVAANSLVRDLLCGWQFTPVHAAGPWWNGELKYDNLDRPWPLEWAQDIASELHAPNFLTQAQSLSDSAEGELQPADAETAFRHWMEMSNTLEDRVLRSQLVSEMEPTWYLLTVKANRMAMQAAATVPAGRLSPLAAEPARERLVAALRWLENKTAQDRDARLQSALAWLSVECDFVAQKQERNEAARYQAFAQQFPTAVESLSAQLRRAMLEPAGDSRLSLLNLAWQDCHQFAVRMQSKLAAADKREARERLAQIRMEILTALAAELYTHRKFAAGDEIAATPAYLKLPAQLGAARLTLESKLHDLTVTHATAHAQTALAVGQTAEASEILLRHLPEALVSAVPAPPGQPTTAQPTSLNVAGLWAQAWLAVLQARGETAAARQFESRVRPLLPAALKEATETVPPASAAPEPLPANPTHPTE